jgi:hypothetical protein
MVQSLVQCLVQPVTSQAQPAFSGAFQSRPARFFSGVVGLSLLVRFFYGQVARDIDRSCNRRTLSFLFSHGKSIYQESSRDSPKKRNSRLTQLGHAFDGYAVGTSLNPGIKGLRKELPRFRRDAAGKRQALRPQTRAAEEQHCRLPASQDARRGVHHPGGGSRARRDGRHTGTTPLPSFHALSAGKINVAT